MNNAMDKHKIKELISQDGRPTTLDEIVISKILDAVPRVLVNNQIAAYVGIPRQTFYSWLNKGKNDHEEGNQTIFAEFAYKLNKAKAHEAERLLQLVESDAKSYKAYAWKLEKCFREDFGVDSEEIQELRKMFNEVISKIGTVN